MAENPQDPSFPRPVPILGRGANDTQRRRVRSEAQSLVKRVRKLIKQHGQRAPIDVVRDLAAQLEVLDKAIAAGDHDATCAAMVKLEDMATDRHFGVAPKSVFHEYATSIGVAVLVALFLRAFVVEAFKIPSGSMIPTMLVGDHIFVNKFIYGLRIPFTKIKFFEWRKPQRGEVIVFMYPRDPDTDFIKRVVAVEGDTVEVRQSVIYVNGKAIDHQQIPGIFSYWDVIDENSDHWKEGRGVRIEEKVNGHDYFTLHTPVDDNNPYADQAHDFPRPQGAQGCDKVDMSFRDGACVVPKDTVFVCGDNRDQSNDSRFWGTVPLENIKGKALVVWWSQGGQEDLHWYQKIRWGRMGHLVE